MPPKKRPAAAGTATSAAKRKKVSMGGISIMGEPDTLETHASGRPKRSSIGEPTYNTTAAKNNATKKAKPEATKSPTKAPSGTATRGRGRPRKDATVQTEQDQAPATTTKPPNKPVSRPKKSARSKLTRVKAHASPVQTARQALKKATRSPKSAVASPVKARGRPKSSTNEATAAANGAIRADKSKSKLKSTKAKEMTVAPKAETDEELDGMTAKESDWDTVEEDDGRQYWLMKAEPNSRIENGVDVKFSIDDLMKAKEPEGWDGMRACVSQELSSMLTVPGVRNLVARNRMRAMKKGDLAFFYHSNTKVPGVVGIMEIVEEHSIDGTPVPN